nr:thioredoxin-related transmembrane protein 2 isoform X2 [Ziziphus jujuba var. spinosa]
MLERNGDGTVLHVPFPRFLFLLCHSHLHSSSTPPSHRSPPPSSRNSSGFDIQFTHCHQDVIYILTQQPAFQGLGTCSKLTPLQLEAVLTEGNISRLWLVEFRASCSSACIRTSRCFPELSITYSTKSLSFGIVDLGLFPNAAAKFGISLGGSMSQLPTYILFENAAEVARLPELDFEAKAYHAPITKKLLSRYFELDRHLLEYVNGK